MAYITRHGAASESLHAHKDELKRKGFGSSLLDGQKRPILEQTLIHWRSWLKQPTSLHSAVFQKRHTGYTQDVCGVLFFNLFTGLSFLFSPFPYLFLFWSFHTYSWRIFKLFSKTRCRTSSSDWPIAASLVYFSGYRRFIKKIYIYIKCYIDVFVHSWCQFWGISGHRKCFYMLVYYVYFF